MGAARGGPMCLGTPITGSNLIDDGIGAHCCTVADISRQFLQHCRLQNAKGISEDEEESYIQSRA